MAETILTIAYFLLVIFSLLSRLAATDSEEVRQFIDMLKRRGG